MKVKVKFKKDVSAGYNGKIIECKAWSKVKNMFWFNKTLNSTNELKMSDKVVCIPAENVLYVEDLEDDIVLEEEEENAD